MKNIRPLSNRVLIKRAEPKTSKGGIILPDAAQEKPKEGSVIAVGPGKLNDKGDLIPMNVKVGDKVLFSTYAGTEVELDREKYLIIAEDELFGILNNS